MNTTHHRAPSNRSEEVSQVAARVKELVVIAGDAAQAFDAAWMDMHVSDLSDTSVVTVCDLARQHFFLHLGMLEGAVERLAQILSYPCDKLPPAPVKPPESLIDGTVLAALFGLYSTCLRLTNPDDLGHQLQPEARQLINDAIHSVRLACKQPTAKD